MLPTSVVAILLHFKVPFPHSSPQSYRVLCGHNCSFLVTTACILHKNIKSIFGNERQAYFELFLSCAMVTPIGLLHITDEPPIWTKIILLPLQQKDGSKLLFQRWREMPWFHVPIIKVRWHAHGQDSDNVKMSRGPGNDARWEERSTKGLLCLFSAFLKASLNLIHYF